MARMIFDLTDDDRSALEAHRIRLGLRSHAETLRALIRGEGSAPAAATPPRPSPSFSHGRSKTVVAPAKRNKIIDGLTDAVAGRVTTRDVHVDVPLAQRRAFNPQPKPGKR